MFDRTRYSFSSQHFLGDFIGWGYQDFAANSGPNLTLTANDNGTNIVFESSRVISNTAIVVIDDGTDTKAYTGTTRLFSTKVEVSTHTGVSITLNGTPNASWGGIRVYYYYSYFSGVPLDYTIPSKSVSAQVFEEFNDLFQSEEEIVDGTVAKQMMYWDGGKWTFTDVTKLSWDSATDTLDTFKLTAGIIETDQFIGLSSDTDLLSLLDDELTVNGGIIAPLIFEGLSNGMKLMPGAGGDIVLFGDVDVADVDLGRKLIVHRRAAEGDNSFQIFVDQFQQGRIDMNGFFKFRSDKALEF